MGAGGKRDVLLTRPSGRTKLWLIDAPQVRVGNLVHDLFKTKIRSDLAAERSRCRQPSRLVCGLTLNGVFLLLEFVILFVPVASTFLRRRIGLAILESQLK